MLVKKNKNARLSPYSKIFFQLGLMLSLLFIYTLLEWKTFDRYIREFNSSSIDTEEILNIPITERILEIKPPPPPPSAPEKIEIVANEKDIEESVLESTETDQSEKIIVEDINKIEEIVEDEVIEADIPFAIIEEAPVFPGCTGTEAQKKLCLQKKINDLVTKNFKTSLAQELGLKPGKKKVYVQFRIDKNGNIVNVRARGPHVRLEKEAIRVVKLIPKMTPGKQRNRPVKVSYTLPITLVVLE